MMKKLIFTAALIALSGSGYAQNTPAKAQHVGDKEMTAEAFIEALTPKPKYKTRGIRFNNQAAAAQPEAQQAPVVAMGITFAYDSDQLTEQAVAQLKPLGEALNSDQLAKFSFNIDGHTDATGSDQYNLDLSRRRAISVGQHLFQNFGVSVDRLLLSGKGEAELYDPQNPAAAINRRVEIKTLVN